VHDVVDFLALSDIDGGQAVGPAAAREGGVPGGAAAVDRHVGVETEDLGQDVLQVAAGFETSEGNVVRVLVAAELVEDDAAELVVDVRVADEEVEGPPQKTGGGVAPWGGEAVGSVPERPNGRD
jgi:hypothetical protein